MWMSDIDAANAGIADNDWIECWNANGAVVGRAIVSSRMPQGLCVMQHATEKTVNTPDPKSPVFAEATITLRRVSWSGIRRI